MVPIFALCCFMLIIYGAYVPHKSAEMQRVICIKFKPGTSSQVIEKHFHDFAEMKSHVKDVVAYSAGNVQKAEGAAAEFDVVHYLTFRTNESAREYAKNIDRNEFIEKNKDKWSNVLEMNSNIEK